MRISLRHVALVHRAPPGLERRLTGFRVTIDTVRAMPGPRRRPVTVSWKII